MRRRQRKPLVLPPPVEIHIESLAHDGRGIGRRDGKAVFVEGALLGEKVLVQYTRCHSNHDEAKVIEVLIPAAERVSPQCSAAHICGGCSLQHMHPDAQIAMKQNILKDQLAHFGNLQPVEWLEPLRGPVFGYRHKARLGAKFVEKKGHALVGFREKNSSFLADIDQCHVLVPEVGLAFPQFRQLIESLQERLQIPQIEVAQGDDVTALVVRHMKPLPQSDVDKLLQFCQPRGFHLYLQPAGPDSLHKVWPDDNHLRLEYRLEDFGLTFRFHPLDFTQVNPAINQKMVRLAVEFLDPQPHEKILDLFCGLGNFTLPLATRAAHVIGVEGDDAMVVRGRENARLNQLDNVEFFAADLSQPFAGQPWAQGGFDKILIDPPRSGALEIVSRMTVFKPARIVYVSCNPATLARDAGELKKQGYRLLKAGVMDMFPHTTHVESIAVFEPE